MGPSIWAPALRIGLTVFENIAHPPQRPNQRLTAIRVYLAAEAVDVNIDDVGVRLYAHTPNGVKNHRPRDNATGIAAQIFQQYEFLRRQIQNLPASRGFTPEAGQNRSSSISRTRKRVASVADEVFLFTRFRTLASNSASANGLVR